MFADDTSQLTLNSHDASRCASFPPQTIYVLIPRSQVDGPSEVRCRHLPRQFHHRRGERYSNWRAKTFTVEICGKKAAPVSRKTSVVMGRVLEADNYVIDIREVFIPFIVMIVIAVDDIYHYY